MELHKCSSPNIVRVMKQRGMKHAWERVETHTWYWPLNMKEKEHLEDLDIDLKIILEWIPKR
jgi:hypothetical protein